MHLVVVCVQEHAAELIVAETCSLSRDGLADALAVRHPAGRASVVHHAGGVMEGAVGRALREPLSLAEALQQRRIQQRAA